MTDKLLLELKEKYEDLGVIRFIAYCMRLAIQWTIGVFAATYAVIYLFQLVFFKGLLFLNPQIGFDGQFFVAAGVLLGISAMVELGYMLFSAGPEAAIDPLILGISAMALAIIGSNAAGNEATLWGNPVFSVLLASISIGILFAVRKYLLVPTSSKKDS